MIDLDREMRALLDEDVRGTPSLADAGPVLRRTRRRQALVALCGLAVALAFVGASVAALAAFLRASEPVPVDPPTPLTPGPLDAATYSYPWNWFTTVDVDGAVWAIGPGLTRFDPASGETRSFTLADDPVLQYVSSISPAREGGVWVVDDAPGDPTVRRFDGEAFHDVQAPGPVCRVAEAPDGTLWGTGCAGGLFRSVEGAWQRVPSDGPVGGSVAVDGHGDVWVARLREHPDYSVDGFGISRYDGITWTSWSVSDGLPSDTVEAIVPVDGQVWVGTTDGLAVYRGGSWDAFPGAEIGMEGVGSIAVADGQVWVAGSSGQFGRIARFDGDTWRPVAGANGFGEVGPHPSVAVGEEGTVWAASDGSGLFRLDGDRWVQEASSGPRPDLFQVVASSSEDVWATGDGYQGRDGVWRLDDGTWTTFPGLPGGTLNQLAVGPEGTLWAATQRGLARFQGSAWEEVASGPHHAIAFAPDGAVWASSGLAIQRVGGGGLEPAALPDLVRAFDIGPGGEIWASCLGFTWETDCLSRLAHYDGQAWEEITPPGIGSGDHLRDIEVTRTGELWVSLADPNGELTVMREQDGGWTRFVDTDAGPPLDVRHEGYVAGVLEEAPDGTVLLLAPEGLYAFGRDRWKRVATGRFTDLSVAPDGAIWLGGDGLFRLQGG